MTNSHNRTNSHQAEASAGQSSSPTNGGSNTSGRFFANNSNAGKYSKAHGGSAKKQQQQQHQSPNASLNSSQDKFFVPLKASMGATSTPGKSRSSPQHRGSPTGSSHVLAQLSSSPPNLSHFAGSKCYDAPAPTALPKPPRHWTGVNDMFTAMPMPTVAAISSPSASPKSSAKVSSSPSGQKQKQQSSYYQKNSKGSAKKQVNQHHRQATTTSYHQQHQQAQHSPIVTCSREYLMAVSTTSSLGGGDYDKFSENLKMVLNVRA